MTENISAFEEANSQLIVEEFVDGAASEAKIAVLCRRLER